jgi:hypothetical protein
LSEQTLTVQGFLGFLSGGISRIGDALFVATYIAVIAITIAVSD